MYSDSYFVFIGLFNYVVQIFYVMLMRFCTCYFFPHFSESRLCGSVVFHNE